MNPKLIFLFVLVAAVYSAPLETEAQSNINQEPSALTENIRDKRDILLRTAPGYLYAGIPYDQYPPGVDPVKCPNYPYCDGKLRSIYDPTWMTYPITRFLTW